MERSSRLEVALGRPERARSSAEPVAWKRSRKRRMTESLTPSRLPTSLADIPSWSHASARPWSSAGNLCLGGMIVLALEVRLHIPYTRPHLVSSVP